MTLSALLIAVSPGLLTAQNAEATVYVGMQDVRGGELGRIGFGASEVRLENGIRTGARLSLNSGPFTGHELSYGYSRSDIDVGGQQEATTNIHDFLYDFVMHLTPRSVAIRPFVLGGAGFSSFTPTSEGAFVDVGGITKFAFNYGGGLKVKMGPSFGLRLDVRDHVTNKPNFFNAADVSGRLHRVEYSVGASLLF